MKMKITSIKVGVNFPKTVGEDTACIASALENIATAMRKGETRRIEFDLKTDDGSTGTIGIAFYGHRFPDGLIILNHK